MDRVLISKYVYPNLFRAFMVVEHGLVSNHNESDPDKPILFSIPAHHFSRVASAEKALAGLSNKDIAAIGDTIFDRTNRGFDDVGLANADILLCYFWRYTNV